MPSIRILDNDHDVGAPVSFAQREDLVSIWSAASSDNSIARRAFGLALGFCVPTLGLPSPDLVETQYAGELQRYGRDCYDLLRSRGASAEEVIAAAGVCFRSTAEVLFPRQDEVDVAEDFTAAGEVIPTA